MKKTFVILAFLLGACASEQTATSPQAQDSSINDAASHTVITGSDSQTKRYQNTIDYMQRQKQRKFQY